MGEIGNDAVQPATSAERVVVLQGHGPVAYAVFDRVLAEAIPLALGARQGGREDAVAPAPSRPCWPDPEGTRARRRSGAAHVLEEDDLTAGRAGENLHRSHEETPTSAGIADAWWSRGKTRPRASCLATGGREETLRLHQANERTMLAWIRTGISLMAFGFAIARFGAAASERTRAAVARLGRRHARGLGCHHLSEALERRMLPSTRRRRDGSTLVSSQDLRLRGAARRRCVSTGPGEGIARVEWRSAAPSASCRQEGAARTISRPRRAADDVEVASSRGVGHDQQTARRLHDRQGSRPRRRRLPAAPLRDRVGRRGRGFVDCVAAVELVEARESIRRAPVEEPERLSGLPAPRKHRLEVPYSSGGSSAMAGFRLQLRDQIDQRLGVERLRHVERRSPLRLARCLSRS